MKKLSENLIRSRREKPWFFNEENLDLDQKIIEETIRNLKLRKCPVCKGNLEDKDNFGVLLPHGLNFEEKYCPKDNYIVRLIVHKHLGDPSGATLYMKIYTNSKYSKIIANSGELVEISKPISLPVS